ncbi:MAG: O-antigen ligase family protein [bacterium]
MQKAGIRQYSPGGDQAHVWPRSLVFRMTAIYMALFVVRPWEKLFPWLGTIHFERMYALCMIVAILFSASHEFQMSFQSVVVLLFLGVIGLSGVLAWNPAFSWDPFYKYLTLVVFYFSLVLVIHTPYEMVFLLAWYIVIMAIYLTKSQWEYFVHGCYEYRMGVCRLVGIETSFGHPNEVAGSIVFSLPILLFLWSFHKEISAGWPEFWRKCFFLLLIGYSILSLSSIILTNSRAGMITCILFFFLASLKGRSFGKKLIQLFLCMAFLALLWQILPQSTQNRFRSIWDKDYAPVSAYTSSMGRIEGFKAGVEAFKKFPLIGIGVGNFIPYRVAHLDGVSLNPHNLIGQMLGETGILGLIGFSLLVLTILVNCRTVKDLARGSSDLTLNMLSGVAGICEFMIILLFVEGLSGHNLLRFYWLWTAAFSSLSLQFTKERLGQLQPWK